VAETRDNNALERRTQDTVVEIFDELVTEFRTQGGFGSVSLEVFFEHGKIVRCQPKSARSIKV